MTPFYTDDWLTLYGGDCREVLASLPADSVDCVVTSPPYWGLRDYGTATWTGGDAECDHQITDEEFERQYRAKGVGVGAGGVRSSANSRWSKDGCPRCGASRVDSQLGLERTPEEYVANLVAVFREVRRVLKPSGTCWLNLGDSYSGYHGNGKVPDSMAPSNKPGYVENMRESTVGIGGLKPKDLVGIPWRVAFALQADGWYLRSEIIWSKPNPMPESVTDRPTKSHEQLFLLTKSPRYYFDSDAVREGLSGMREDAASSGVLSASEPEQPVVTMPRVQRPTSAGMAQASWLDGQDEAGESSVRGNGSGPGDEAEARPLGSEADGNGQLSSERGGSRSEPSMDGFTEGSGPMGSLLPRSTDGDGRTLDPDRRGVASDQGVAEEPLPVLRSEQAADDGSRHPGEQGRDAHEGERGGGLQALQQPKARSPHMAATPRNDGDRWREVDGGVAARGAGRNLRSVWTIATRPYPGAHFAVFPPELPERCIKAGSSERGVCPECGAPWERVVERGSREQSANGRTARPEYIAVKGGAGATSVLRDGKIASRVEVGWRPTCACHGDDILADGTCRICGPSHAPVPAVVLDPFAGSGTVGMVANRLSRRAILIDLNPEYLVQQMKRNAQTPLGLTEGDAA